MAANNGRILTVFPNQSSFRRFHLLTSAQEGINSSEELWRHAQVGFVEPGKRSKALRDRVWHGTSKYSPPLPLYFGEESRQTGEKSGWHDAVGRRRAAVWGLNDGFMLFPSTTTPGRPGKSTPSP